MPPLCLFETATLRTLSAHEPTTQFLMETIGRYKVVNELGRGGMATVYRALDPSFEREVAIKVLPQAFLHDPHFRARFEREAKVVAALEHAAIVPVYDFGEDNGMPFIVMRMMSGGSLADRLKDSKYELEPASQVIVRLASALDAAHQKGVIHRDLKPGNILFDQYNNAYLSDFGIARIAEAGATLTGSNILGTPAYMSPEQVQGEHDLDGRSDLYSLGVLFYQMLVGNTPYQATTPAKIMMMHLLEPVPNLINALPDVPPEVAAWFQKVLAKDPQDRFSTAGEMAAALQAALRGERSATMAVPSKPLRDAQRTVIDSAAVGSTAIKGAAGYYPPRNDAVRNDATMATPAQGNLPPQTGWAGQGTPPPLTPPPTGYAQGAAQPRSGGGARWLPLVIAFLGIGGILVIAVGALGFFGWRGSGPLAGLFGAAPSPTPTKVLALLPSDTPEPQVPVVIEASETSEPTATDLPEPTQESFTPTAEPSTNTPEPTLTPTPSAPVVGGADLIAFVDDDDIWVVNVDGSEPRRLTNDGAEKNRLGWTPDGAAVTYISGKCIWAVEVESGRQDFIACFETAKYIDDFAISHDGTRAAISLNLELFVVPYDRQLLSQARFRSDLIAMSDCEVLNPLKTNTGASVAVTQVRWSADDNNMALKVIAPENGIQVDLIRYTDISSCQYTDTLDEFPASRFKLDGYDKTPYIQTFGFDGYYLFAMVNYERNDGYGYLYFYNTDLHRAETKVSPLSPCCYRDPQFSPDGRYMIFAYQPYEPGATTQLYYVPFATLGTGGNLQPLPLPEDLFTNTKVKPQPVLRPAQ
jgi:predicted Ser/Thr protein kinase